MSAGPVVTTRDGATLTTQLLGDPAGARVLLQHGVGSSIGYLAEAVAPPLVAAGWCVVAADLRGHGAASPVREVAGHGLDHLAHDVAALVEVVQPVAVGGVSLGAHAAVAAVARGLVAVERVVAALPAWTGPALAGGGAHAAVATEVRRDGVAGMRARLHTEEGLRPWLRRVLVRDLALHDERSLEAALLALDGGRAPSIDELVGLRCHLGVIGWPDDPGHPLSTARAWSRAAEHGHLVTLTLDDPDRDPVALGRSILAALDSP